VLAPVLASLAILGGSAQEPVCHGQLSPAAKEQARIDGYAAERARYGFRSDVEYVRELIEAGHLEIYPSFPATPAERRYLRLRARLGIDPPVYQYLLRRRDVDGWGDAGFYVRGTFPLPDRLLVYVMTPRDDRAAYFRERYGPAVGTLLVGTRYECEQ
jgi:hypothetical protein